MSRIMIKRIKISPLKKNKRRQDENVIKDKQAECEALIENMKILEKKYHKSQAEIIHRDKELANQTNRIIQKNRLLSKVNEDLNSIQNFVTNDVAKKKIYNLRNRINKEIDDKQQERIFETYFGEVHEEFFRNIKEKHPVLSSNDLRLCAYIRMNLTTREIASLLNISYRGAEISRYRLRKKLDLDRGTNLSTFLSNF